MTQCRICLEDASLNELISPCLCDGTSKYVHTECLNTWRNTTSRAFSQCTECHFNYALRYDFPLEKFKITIPSINDEMGRYVYTLLIVLLSSFFLRILDKILKYPSLYILNLGYNVTNKEILEEDEINSGCYYFSLNNCIISIISHIWFWVLITIKINRRMLYWKSVKIPFIFRFFLSIHFIWLYWIIGGGSVEGFNFFTIADATISLINISRFVEMLREHNQIIHIMNTQKNKTTVLPRLLEDIV